MKLLVAAFAFAAPLVACGGSSEPAKSPDPSGSGSADAPSTGSGASGSSAAAAGAEAGASGRPGRRPKMSMSGDLGALDPKAVQAAVDGVQGQIKTCWQSGRKKVEYLAGEGRYLVRLGEDGSVKYAFFESSTLGDRDTEKCILQALRGARWPKPEGGEGEVRNSVAFDAGSEVRAPFDWAADKAAAAVAKIQSNLASCKGSASGTFKATAYIEPDGKNGKVQAIGIAPPSKEGEGGIDCMVTAFKGASFPSPGSYAAKVSFGF